jgi:Excalibur calcium-binding domain/Protein of unknown function (DUF732)
MRKPAQITLGIVGTFVAISVISAIANAGNTPAPSATAALTTNTTPATAATPTTTPAPTSAAPVALTADDLFVADVIRAPGLTSTVPSSELVGLGRAICSSIGIPGVSHASLLGVVDPTKWGPSVAEVVVSAAERNLCPERHYVAMPTVAPAAPAPPAPAARPEPAPVPAPPAPQPVEQPAPRDSSSSAYYPNCAAARAAGAAPLHVGDPGYRPALDRDKDGIACE